MLSYTLQEKHMFYRSVQQTVDAHLYNQTISKEYKYVIYTYTYNIVCVLTFFVVTFAPFGMISLNSAIRSKIICRSLGLGRVPGLAFFLVGFVGSTGILACDIVLEPSML